MKKSNSVLISRFLSAVILAGMIISVSFTRNIQNVIAQDGATATPGDPAATETQTPFGLPTETNTLTPMDPPVSTETPMDAGFLADSGIQPLAVDYNGFYYYDGEQRIPLLISSEWILVMLDAGQVDGQIQGMDQYPGFVGALDQAYELLNPNQLLIPLADGQSFESIIQGINTIRAASRDFPAVNPVFTTPDALMVVTNEFIATFPDKMTRKKINSLNAERSVQVVERISDQGNTFVLRVTPETHVDALSMANYYKESGIAITAAPNFVRVMNKPVLTETKEEVNSLSTANDYWYGEQWHLHNTSQFGSWMKIDVDIDAPEAWNITKGSSAIIIAILDEGVDRLHPDLNAKIIKGYDATGKGGGGRPSGNDAHGTAAAGIAAAVSNNNTGVAGVCWNCRIMPVRIAYGCGGGWCTSDSIIAKGINYAYQNGAWVLSNSWGGGSPSTVISTAINNAKTLGRGGRGAVVVFSAGNNNTTPISYPASLSTVISVGASNMCDQRKNSISNTCNGYESWWGSSYGPGLDISAPGVWITTTDIRGSAGYGSGDYYLRFNGTSSAAPIVSGVVGLMLSVNPTLTAAQVQDILQKTADDVNKATKPGYDTQMGWGRVNAYRAVYWVKLNLK